MQLDIGLWWRCGYHGTAFFPQNVVQKNELVKGSTATLLILWIFYCRRLKGNQMYEHELSWILQTQGASVRRAMKEKHKIPLVETIKKINW